MNLKMRCLLKLLFTVVFAAVFTVSGYAVTSKININTATVEQLAQLKRIGPSYAQRIISYREQNGSFKNPKDITKVKGIGLKTYEANKAFIIVSDEGASVPE